MLLVKGQKIAGYPAREIRRLMKKIGTLSASVSFIAEILECSPPNAKSVIARLRREGYLSAEDGAPGYVSLTSKGLALASATLRPISRATATKHLSTFLGRIPQINSDPMHAFTVSAVVVFGSFLSEKELLGDLDVAAHLVAKPLTDAEYRKRCDGLLDRAWREGRVPNNVVEWSCWPTIEVLRDLRRSLKQLRIHQFHGLEKMRNLECAVVFGDSDTVKALLPNARIIEPQRFGHREAQREIVSGERSLRFSK